MTLLRDNRGANAVECALIMALCAVFIIGGLILMSTQMGSLFPGEGARSDAFGRPPGHAAHRREL